MRETGHSMQFIMDWPEMGTLSWKETRKECMYGVQKNVEKTKTARRKRDGENC